MYGVAGVDCWSYLRMTNAKANMGPAGGPEQWLRSVSVKLFSDDEDTVGTLEKAEISQVAEMDPDDFIRVKVPELLPVDEEISFYALTKLLLECTDIGLKHKAVYTKLPEIYAKPVYWGDFVFKPVNVKSVKGDSALGLRCEVIPSVFN